MAALDCITRMYNEVRGTWHNETLFLWTLMRLFLRFSYRTLPFLNLSFFGLLLNVKSSVPR